MKNGNITRAKALRTAAGHSFVDLAVALDVPAVAILAMERGDEAAQGLAVRVIGHYRGVANMRPTNCPVGTQLRAMRIVAGDTQEGLAAAMGIDSGLVSKLEHNALYWSKPMARRIAAHYGQSIDHLLKAAA